MVRLRTHRNRTTRFAAAGTAVAAFLASIAALFGLSVATAPQAVPQVVPACTFNGVAANGALDVTPGVTSVAISCTGLPINSQVFVADASPLAGVLTAPNITDQLNLTMGFALAVTDAAGNLNTSFLIPATTVSNNTDGTCPPTQAQVNTGLTNCALAVASLTGTPFGFVLLNYPGQPAPPTPNLTLNPTSGDVGTSVAVSGTGWWGSGTTANPPAITVGGVAATTSTANVPAATYTIGGGAFGSGGTLTGGDLTGAFTIPSGVGSDGQPVVVTQPNMHPLNNAPYTGVPISATATFTMPVPTPLAITTTSLTDATALSPYSATVMATGGTTPYTWSATGLPASLSIDPATGVISGTPTCAEVAGSPYSVGVTVTDSTSATASATFSLTVLTSPGCVVVPPDGSLTVVMHGPLRSATDHKTVVAKVTNTGTQTFTISGGDIAWMVPVGSVGPNTSSATLAPGGSANFRFTWSYDSSVIAGQSYTVTGTALSGPLATDPTPADNTSSVTKVAK
jgi:hypothetical protein